MPSLGFLILFGVSFVLFPCEGGITSPPDKTKYTLLFGRTTKIRWTFDDDISKVRYQSWYFQSTDGSWESLAKVVYNGTVHIETKLFQIDVEKPATLVLKNVNQSYNGNYYFTIHTTSIPDTSSVIVFIAKKPNVTFSCSSPITVNEGDTVKCVCRGEGGNPPANITWSKNSTRIGERGTENQTLTLPNVGGADSGIYKCVAQNYPNVNYADEKSIDVIVKLNFKPNKTVITFTPNSAVLGELVNITCEVNGFPDWYVAVYSFASGLVLSCILACLLTLYCRRCGRIKTLVVTPESQEALALQNGADFNPIYEEVPGGENDGLETFGSFEQTFRSDSMDSRTNLVVHHCEPSKLAEYQHPRIVMEPIYTNCGKVDGKSNGQPGAEEHSGATEYGESSNTTNYQHPRTGQSGLEAVNEDGESTSVTNYQHPKPDLETDEVSRLSEASIPGDYLKPKTKPEHVYSECEVVTQDGNPALLLRPKVTPSKAPQYSKPPSSRKSEAPPNYQIPSPITQNASPTKYQIPPTPKSAPHSPKLIPSSRPSDLATEDKSQDANYQYSETDMKFLEGSLKKGENPPTPSKSQPPLPALGNKKSSRDANCQLPEIDAEFLGNGDKNLQDETSAPITSGNEESNRDSNYNLPEIDMKFLESGDKSLIQPPTSQSLTLPLRTPSQKSPSARTTIATTSSAPPLPSKTSILPSSSSPPALPSRMPSEKSPSARPTMTPTSVQPPALPSKTSAVKSPIMVPSSLPLTSPSGTRLSPKSSSSGPTSSPPPVLPSKTSSKSPAMVPSSSPTQSKEVPPIPQKVSSPVSQPPTSATPPPVPPKPTPPLPGKSKPASPTSPALYAELNELDRQDDTANYQHLSPMTKQ